MRSSALWMLVLIGTILRPDPAAAIKWPWSMGSPWPDSSDLPVETLAHPTVESVFEARARDGLDATPYRFAAFGDQRALADGEWQEILHQIRRWETEHEPLAFLLDTGDLVYDGRKTDQFAWLAEEILSIVPDSPYLVGVGNHEVKNNDDPAARENIAHFLAYLDPDLAPERLWYRKDLGGATFLFLDTNDFIYGPAGDRKECPRDVDPASREGQQLIWLREQLAETAADPDRLVIAVLHHPPIQSSKKHRTASCSIWTLREDGVPLIDRLVDGGVDMILTGHTHTYERFRLVRHDGRELHVVNVSGRPRDSVFWIGAGDRRAKDIRGREVEYLSEKGWEGISDWEVHQEEVLEKSDEGNQFAIFTVEPGGGLVLETHFLDEDAPGGTRVGEPVRLRQGGMRP